MDRPPINKKNVPGSGTGKTGEVAAGLPAAALGTTGANEAVLPTIKFEPVASE